MKKILTLCIVLTTACLGLKAQGNTVSIHAVDNGQVTEVTFFAPTIVRVQKYPA